MCNFASPLCSRKRWSLFFGNFVYAFANHLCCRVTHQDFAGHKGTIQTQDMQVDLDLGNYERFLDVTLTRDNNITTGKIYQGGRHHQLLESLTPVLRDFKSYFSVKRKSPYQCTQTLKHHVPHILLLMS
ncbi:uncharacterized protein LOC126621529 isoform X1 [Malus sylvestris]|uniref:uncharacterized protein LOC126621529 isoform X1 n=1 Tax=Malus sylvestris TaxID=3752 RepID=UPI0021AC207B|nr:uncharacterized protein LOC126621529 isoform X1 [Malus sylvestris]XP_050146015.1 uncharacterized protein LOC126621529 isoform X1 [Malus sylvestris]